MEMEVQTRCCEQCKPCVGDFKKVVDLPYSGLVIYVHTKKDEQNESTFDVSKGIIFHNTTDKELSKPKYLGELSQYKTKYSHIKIIIKRVRSLLDEIVVIKGNQVIGICEHCKKANTTKKCKKCTYMVREFLADKNKIIEEKQKLFKEWLLKVKHLLQSILNAHSVCKHMAYKDTELERILKELKTPLSMRIPDIDSFPNIEGDQTLTQSITESKEMLEELLSRIQSEGIAKPLSSNDSLYPSPPDYKETCICKLVKEGHFLENEISTWSTDKTETALIDSISESDFKKENAQFLLDLLQRLQDLKRGLVLDSFKTADKVLKQNLIKSINYVHKQGLLPAYVKKLIDQISQLRKELSFDGKAGEHYKSLIDSLLTDLKKYMIMTDGVSKHLLKVLTEVCTRTADQFSKSADVTQAKEQSHEQPAKLTSQQYVAKESHSTMVPDASKLVIPKTRKEQAAEQPSIERKEIKPKLSEESSKDLSKPKEVVKALSKVAASRSFADKRKEPSKTLSKEMPSELQKDGHKEVRQASPKDQSYTPSKDKLKESRQALLKDHVSEPTKQKEKETGQALPKGSPAGKHKETLSKDTAPDLNKDAKNKMSEKDAHDDFLRQKLLELGRALSQGLSQALDKELVQDLSNNLKQTITKDTQNVTKGVIGALTDVCKVLAKGLPKNLNKMPVIDILEEMNDIFTRGLSSDQNKEKLQTKLRELEKALTQTIKTETNKEEIAPQEKLKNKMQKEKESPPIKGMKAEDKTKSKEETGKKQVKEEKPIKEIQDDKPSKVETNKKDAAKDKIKTQEDLLFEKLLAQHKSTRLKEREDKDKNAAKLKSIKSKTKTESLPKLPEKKSVEPIISTETDSSQSFDYGQTDAKYIIIGTSLKSRTSYRKEEPAITAKPALFFKNKIVLDDLEEIPEITFKELSEENKVLDTGGTGVIQYRLSDREFIDNGWTKLPVKKIMRRMNIYRMQPAYPQYDWFKRNQEKKVMFYDTGERLAEVTDDGRGKWYYKNGALALDYYNAEEMFVGQRYIVYSSGEECENGRRKPPTVLALFDFLGNGVVYDYNGNVRLKYNQSEGVIVDPKIGPPSRWKWHTLNEPPVLQQVFVNSHLAIRDPFIEKLGHNEVEHTIDIDTKEAQSAMLQIELENFVKEKSQKLMQQFKPFQIKMKAMKLNEQFSLKILDQANISLKYRDGRTSLKLNLGMNLNNHEIIDTDISDATDVSTPYDKFPARTDSVENVQSILQSIRKANKLNLKSFSSYAELSSKIS